MHTWETTRTYVFRPIEGTGDLNTVQHLMSITSARSLQPFKTFRCPDFICSQKDHSGLPFDRISVKRAWGTTRTHGYRPINHVRVLVTVQNPMFCNSPRSLQPIKKFRWTNLNITQKYHNKLSLYWLHSFWPLRLSRNSYLCYANATLQRVYGYRSR